jgi:hypothetical protein
MLLSNAAVNCTIPLPFALDNEPAFRTEPVSLGYAYWKSKVAGGRVPSRCDIDPLEMVRFLPNTVLLDVASAPFDFRYRVIGTECVAHMKRDWTGNWMSEIPHQGPSGQFWGNLQRVAADQTPLYSNAPQVGPEADFSAIEDVILPLVDQDGSTNMLLTFIGFHPLT